MRSAICGKTHSFPDWDGMKRLNIEVESDLGQHLANIGFEPFHRDDGLHPNDQRSENIAYNQYLREQGYDAQNGWQKHANGAIDENGEWINGHLLRAGEYAADIEEPHSETPYTTRRAMEFIDDAGENPWCLHLSYIKPHWPCIAPAPYDSMYGPETFLPLVAEESEMDNPHPVYEAYTQMQCSRGLQDPAARTAVIKAYMGLIKQIDDQIGELMAFMEEKGLVDNTMIVFTSDHGDYLGDHWLGEKSWFHEASVRVPMIIVDPSESADGTRGTVCDELVESIDLVPTFIERLGGEIPDHRLEGRSLLPLLAGDVPADWREFAVSEVDYADRGARYILNENPHECNTVMICTKRWKYIHIDNYRPQLFDLENDPNELVDLGGDEAYTAVIQQMQQYLITFLLRRKTRVTLKTDRIDFLVGGFNRESRGILIGFPSEEDVPEVSRKFVDSNRYS